MHTTIFLNNKYRLGNGCASKWFMLTEMNCSYSITNVIYRSCYILISLIHRKSFFLWSFRFIEKRGELNKFCFWSGNKHKCHIQFLLPLYIFFILRATKRKYPDGHTNAARLYKLCVRWAKKESEQVWWHSFSQKQFYQYFLDKVLNIRVKHLIKWK